MEVGKEGKMTRSLGWLRTSSAPYTARSKASQRKCNAVRRWVRPIHMPVQNKFRGMQQQAGAAREGEQGDRVPCKAGPQNKQNKRRSCQLVECYLCSVPHMVRNCGLCNILHLWGKGQRVGAVTQADAGQGNERVHQETGRSLWSILKYLLGGAGGH
jgi:hypothetical protein